MMKVITSKDKAARRRDSEGKISIKLKNIEINKTTERTCDIS